MKVWVAAGIGLASMSLSVHAADVTECAVMLEDDSARLACYDRIVMGEIKRLKAEKEAAASATPAPSTPVSPAAPAKPVATTVSTPAPSKPDPVQLRAFKRVDVTDVMATPTKWVNRDIEFASANVYWVSDDDLRVITAINMTLFARAATGSAEDLAYLKENCETAKEAQSAKCRVRVRFAYNDHSEDKPNGFSKRTVLVSPSAELIRLQAARRR